MASIIQNFHPETETCVNKLIRMELTSSYVYLAMASHCDRDDVALKGFHQFFKDISERKKQNADKLMKKQNERGGRMNFEDLQAPSRSHWGEGGDGLAMALEAEKKSNEQFITFHTLAGQHEDKHTMDWVEDEFLAPHVDNIKKLGDMKMQLARAGAGVGEYLFDLDLSKKGFE